MAIYQGSSVLLADSETGVHLEQKGTGGAALVLEAIHVAASVDANPAITSDVNAAVPAQIGLRFVGYACREVATVPAAAAFIIVHGATAGGASIVPVELALSASENQWFGPEGIAAPDGISIDWISGQVDVNLFYKVV